MRPRLRSTCLASTLKLFNFVQAFVGSSFTVYSVSMLSRWNVDESEWLPEPWFIDIFLAAGVPIFSWLLEIHRFWLCVEFSELINRRTFNRKVLIFVGQHAVLMYVLIMIEGSLLSIMTLNARWKEDLPVDHTGELEKLENFVKFNIDFFRWVGAAVVVFQVLSMLLALTIRCSALIEKQCEGENDGEILILKAPPMHPFKKSTPAAVLGREREREVNSASRVRVFN